MSYDLSRLPIDRANHKKVTITVFSFILVTAWALTLLILSSEHWNPHVIFAMRNWPYIVLWDLAPIYVIASVYRRHSRLFIDQSGVHVTAGGRTRNYLWPDIEGVREVPTGARNGSTVLKIMRKGQIFVADDTDLIWGEFGLNDSQLTAIIEAGKSKWGGGNGADLRT